MIVCCDRKDCEYYEEGCIDGFCTADMIEIELLECNTYKCKDDEGQDK